MNDFTGITITDLIGLIGLIALQIGLIVWAMRK